MSLKKSFFIVLSAFVLGPFSSGQDKSLNQKDGTDWLEATNNNYRRWYCLGFIAGVMMGTEATYQATKGGLDIAKISLESAKVNELQIDMISSTQEKLKDLRIVGIAIGQMKDRMDTFYADFANRPIKIIDAFFIVKMQIDGRDPDLIRAQIGYLRMPMISREEFTRLNHKLVEGKEILTEEERLKRGLFIDKNNVPHLLFRYGDYR
jgi:hypothetical protein